MTELLVLIDAIGSWLRMDSRCGPKWRADRIHCTPDDFLWYRPHHKGAVSGMYFHVHDGFIDLGKYEYAYDNIGSALFVSVLLIPIPEREVDDG